MKNLMRMAFSIKKMEETINKKNILEKKSEELIG